MRWRAPVSSGPISTSRRSTPTSSSAAAWAWSSGPRRRRRAGAALAGPASPALTGPTGPPLVRLADVGKTYANGVLALDGVSLAVASGEFVSLLGPSGCGKSTILRLVAGLSPPSAGTVELGATPGEADALRREISFVFQEPTLMPWATVAANVLMPLRVRRVPRREAEDRVAEALALVGLDGFAKSYPRELSGGMKMRVSIARALVIRPRLLLLDEPFAALDEITRFRLNDDLVRLWRQFGWTVLFVTHSVFESVYLSSRVLVMSPRPGRVVQDIAVPDAARNEAWRMGPEYNALCREVSLALHAAMGDRA
ncbi:MAG: ABC transporter ATP-binding protein [Bauldia sp.]|nr:ABC transporter ATP-binding protein [Bauldia sp.]